MYCEEKIQLKDAFWGEKVHLIREKVPEAMLCIIGDGS